MKFYICVCPYLQSVLRKNTNKIVVGFHGVLGYHIVRNVFCCILRFALQMLKVSNALVTSRHNKAAYQRKGQKPPQQFDSFRLLCQPRAQRPEIVHSHQVKDHPGTHTHTGTHAHTASFSIPPFLSFCFCFLRFSCEHCISPLVVSLATSTHHKKDNTSLHRCQKLNNNPRFDVSPKGQREKN